MVAADHPLSGRALRARRAYRRYGRLWLVVELPDGGETSVEVGHTDVLAVETIAARLGGVRRCRVRALVGCSGCWRRAWRAAPSTSRGRAEGPMSGEVPVRARELAARLSALFRSDCELAERLNDAQRRLLGANDRLWSGLDPDAHWVIRSAFCQYQFACEERRRLAVDVGELSGQLIEVLCAAGWSEEAARDADVHELATAGARW